MLCKQNIYICMFLVSLFLSKRNPFFERIRTVEDSNIICEILDMNFEGLGESFGKLSNLISVRNV